MGKATPIITLLTDFGTVDGYVGAMKGVIAQIAPGSPIIDITHSIQPQDVHQAARTLCAVYPYYPNGTVHIVVVDPGVGSARHPIAVRTARGVFVGPDNGVFTYVFSQEEAWTAYVLTQSEYWLPGYSHTFHGRDIFAPVAAHLAAGTNIHLLGKPLENPIRLTFPVPFIDNNSIRGEIVAIDHFGNLITNIGLFQWKDDGGLVLRIDSGTYQLGSDEIKIVCGALTLQGMKRTYSQVAIGECLGLVSSRGELEIAANQGSAQQLLPDVGIGSPVVLYQPGLLHRS